MSGKQEKKKRKLFARLCEKNGEVNTPELYRIFLHNLKVYGAREEFIAESRKIR